MVGMLLYLGIGVALYYILRNIFGGYVIGLSCLCPVILFWPLILLGTWLLFIISMIDKWSKGGKYR